MPDVTLAAKATQPAPLDYPIPAAAELILKCLTADFDGSGAAGSFVPCVQILLPNNVVMGTFELGQTIAAGVSADVSWFPGVTPPASTASTSGLWAQMSATLQGVPSGTQAAMDFGNNLSTNDTVTFTRDVYPNTASPLLRNKHGLGIHKAGLYQIDVAAYFAPVLAPANPIYTYGMLVQQDAGDGSTVIFEGGPNQVLSSDAIGFNDPNQGQSFSLNFRQLIAVTNTGTGTLAMPYTVDVSQACGQAFTGGVSIAAEFVSAS